jgi:hypothetical protein
VKERECSGRGRSEVKGVSWKERRSKRTDSQENLVDGMILEESKRR